MMMVMTDNTFDVYEDCVSDVVGVTVGVEKFHRY